MTLLLVCCTLFRFEPKVELPGQQLLRFHVYAKATTGQVEADMRSTETPEGMGSLPIKEAHQALRQEPVSHGLDFFLFRAAALHCMARSTHRLSLIIGATVEITATTEQSHPVEGPYSGALDVTATHILLSLLKAMYK